MPIYILGKHLRGTTNWAYFNLQLGKLSQNAYILGKHLRGTTNWAYFNLQLGKLSQNAYILGKHLRGTTNWPYFNLQLGKLSQNAYILGKHLRGTTNWAYLTYNWVNFPQMPIYTVKMLGMLLANSKLGKFYPVVGLFYPTKYHVQLPNER